MPSRVAVLQSNYLPWKGYFDIIHDVDLFVFYDDVQYTKNDWRNRNIIKTAAGPKWLTVPVGKKEDRLICEVEIQDATWALRHWGLLKQHYGDAPFFDHYAPLLEEVYIRRTWTSLSALNHHLITCISQGCLGMTTELRDSREFSPQGRKAARLLDLLRKLDAQVYVSGPSARDYIPEADFEAAGIQVVWKDYSGYPEYPQSHPPFSHQVSILDLLFHVGPDAPAFIWGWRTGSNGGVKDAG